MSKNQNKIKKVVNEVIKVAIEYEKAVGRQLTVTGEIGEILVCEKLKLKLVPNPINPGFDATDDRNRKYQIKARRVKGKSKNGRLSRFSTHRFNWAILAILNKEYELSELYRVSYRKLKPIIEAQKRSAPSLRQFIRLAGGRNLLDKK